MGNKRGLLWHPLQNLWGWSLTDFTTFALYVLISGKPAKLADVRFDRLAMAGYLVTALGIVLISLVSGVGNLALIGFFAMMLWAIAGWVKMA